MMGDFEQRIADAVNVKLNDGTVEKLVGQYVEKSVSDALKDIFGYGGDGKKLIEEKLGGVIVPAIERHDFNQYLTKLDTVLTGIVNSTNLADNKKILENLKGLMKKPDMEEIKLSEIFEQYCRHVAENVSTDGLEARCEDGEPYFEHVTARMKVEHNDKRKRYSRSDFDDCTVTFMCEEDENLEFRIRLYRRTCEDKWKILDNYRSVDILSLRGLSKFEIFIMNLKRAFVEIVMDEESDCDHDIEPEEQPEWRLG